MKRFLIGVVLALAYCGIAVAADDSQHGQLQNAVYLVPATTSTTPAILVERAPVEMPVARELLAPAASSKRLRSDMRVAGAGLVFDGVLSALEQSRTQWC